MTATAAVSAQTTDTLELTTPLISEKVNITELT